MIRRSPTWASRMSVSDHGALLRELRAVFARRTETFTTDEDGLHVTDAAGKTEPYGLDNLSRAFVEASPAKRPKVVRSFVESMLEATRTMAARLEEMADFDRVRSRVKVRLHPASHVRHPGMDTIVHWIPVEGLVATLVCDFDAFNSSVSRHTLEQWPLSQDEAVALALDNVAAQNPVEVSPQIPGFDVPLFGIERGGPYTATHALMLDRVLDGARPFGFLLVIPEASAMAYHPIRDARIHGAMAVMSTLAEHAYERSANAVSRELFWWHAGRLARVPAARVGERLVIDGTGEFGDVVFRGLAKQSLN